MERGTSAGNNETVGSNGTELLNSNEIRMSNNRPVAAWQAQWQESKSQQSTSSLQQSSSGIRADARGKAKATSRMTAVRSVSQARTGTRERGFMSGI